MFRWHLKFLLKSGSTVYCHIETKHVSSDAVIREDLHLGSGFTVFPTNLPNQVVAVDMAEVSAFWISDKTFSGEEETK